MEIEILVEIGNRKEFKLIIIDSHKIKDILRELNLNSEEVLVSKNNEFVSIEDFVKNKDKLKIIRVIVGG